MAEEKKVTIMILDVDLQCPKCYKKVKKVLCKFPQIRDQVYDEKNNKVIIKVVCCSPEKIRDKLCCKGGGSIKRIEIKEPEKPKEQEKQKPQPDKTKEKGKGKPPQQTEPGGNKTPEAEGPVCHPRGPPLGLCCSDCYNGRHGGPCEMGWRGAPRFEYYGRPVYDSWGGGGYRGCYYESWRCDTYFFEDNNPQSCSIL